MPLKVDCEDDDPDKDGMMNEGNVTQSVIEAESSLPPFDPSSLNGAFEKTNRLDLLEENKFDSLENYSIDDGNESICERKKETAIPVLKNNEKVLQNKKVSLKSFTERHRTMDFEVLSSKMIDEINRVS